MKVHIVGGGPGGLYLAILLKRQDPAHDITIWERNRPDDTFGFGVVFSDRTQSHLASADPESHGAITESFAQWDAIDVHYRGRTLRSHGHGFAGLSRKRLLGILYDRARELGVRVNFRDEVTDVEAVRDADLVVGADGLNSLVRRTYETAFSPTLDVRPNRYVWLGSDKSLDAFTFSFRENDAGLFMLHAYQFAKAESTFIVECDEATWRGSKLAVEDEAATIQYLEGVFAAELEGHRLVGNRSRWIQFTTVKNAHWSHENVVLIGDAAHTAHFSIGSGTKLAMEDVIALAASLKGAPTVRAALERYESERRPQTDSIQRAAQCSLEWFENARRYTGLDPVRFNFSLLTRSLRVTHENLRVRDAAVIDEADRWFVEASGETPTLKPTEGTTVPPMFVPFELRGMRLENRVVVSPMCQYSAVDGVPNEWHLVHLGSRAIGGAGLVIAEMTNVSPEGRITPGCAGLWNRPQMEAWRRVVEFVHGRSRSKIGIQLAHAGRKASTELPWRGGGPLKEGAWPVIGPSAVPWAKGYPVPAAMDRTAMDRIRDAFVASTRLADEAGFDLVEVHMAHGYLLS
ncbi:MAG: FAD-dependent monooxygenase, partial [Myxococcales bacterium]|nr:FAD-dependent monooxygenase [Myxococcales bacterium]